MTLQNQTLPDTTGFISPALADRERSAVVELPGGPARYWEHSAVDPDPGTTRTILVIHGFRGDHHGLLRLVDLMPGHRFITPDLPGFGASEAFQDREHSLENYARFVAEFMEALDLGPDTVLLGHSFGSLVCSRFVTLYPGRVTPLILINPIAAPALEGPKALLTKLAIAYYRAAAALPEKAGRALLANPAIVRVMSVTMARTKQKDLRRFIHAQHDAYFSDFASRESLLESFRASVSGTVTEVADRITLPTLLIAGSTDEVAPLPAQEKLQGVLPDSRLVVIDGVGHLIHYETPQAAAHSIELFLQEHPA
ncbi:alpha/beta fold hydrolase [Arthrobacter woluwensis]|uniref:alpha/beta fold hydrolase n=1 Tax=Arthrobacter woluwensis TaxID=156980 RepID=UPI0011A9E314|nr:alpha/beta hydrolase [Arthrobacter woluwensis]